VPIWLVVVSVLLFTRAPDERLGHPA
jgi:hypothetical protein